MQCPKYLWLAVNKPDLAQEADSFRFEQGYEVENYARELSPNGVEVKSEDETRKLVSKGEKTLFQAVAKTANLYCVADILVFDEQLQVWDIYEVKSSNDIEDIYTHDLAFQRVCFERAGYKIGKTYIVHLNKEYIRQGEIDPEDLLTKEDLTEQVLAQMPDTEDRIYNALRVLERKDKPECRILKQCGKPYVCNFLQYCFSDIPEESIYDLAGGLTEKRLNMLLDEGVLKIKDIPADMVTSKAGKRHYDSIVHKEIDIDADSIKKELTQLQYPIYFLDYETFSPAIPMFDGYKPYQRIVFQYSLHVLRSPDGELEHYEYLHTDLTDPTEKLAEALKSQIEKEGSVIAWYMSFEKGCNSEMGERRPRFQEFFQQINDRMYDLMSPFKQGLYVHRGFKGSASIKKVLPVLVPELSYKDLDIQEGMAASKAWYEMIQKDDENIKNNLLKYCELDTLAMVEILRKLKSL